MQNWGGNIEFRASTVHRPVTIDELREVVVRSRTARVIGTRHSFNRIADDDTLIDLSMMPADVVIDPEESTVLVAGNMSYGHLADELQHNGLALHNLASLPHISVAGAVATATHGSGATNGNLATAVLGMEILRSNGKIGWVRGHELNDAVVHLGALGVVTRLELAVEPTYNVSQTVLEGITWVDFFDGFAKIMTSATSVSVFTTWGPTVGQVWTKQRAGADSIEIAGAAPASEHRHPIPGLDASSCTQQLGLIGPWHERLPHFRMGFTPSGGDEIQSEWHVPASDGTAAIGAVRAVADQFSEVLMVSEIRTVDADRLLLSPQFDQKTVSLHFTWMNRPRRVAEAVDVVEAALAPFAPRAHLGKAFTRTRTGIDPARRQRFVDVCREWDPMQMFWNQWLEDNFC